MATFDSIFSIVIFIFACRYLKQHCWVLANPSRNWTFHRFVRIADKERTQRNKMKTWHSLEFEPKSSAFSSASFSFCFLSLAQRWNVQFRLGFVRTQQSWFKYDIRIWKNTMPYIYISIIYIYNSKSLDVVQSLYFGSKLPSSGTYK